MRGSTVTQVIAFWLRTEKVVGICSFLGLPPNKVVPRLKQKVMSFKQGMPVITSLRNAALRTRHWEAIQNVIGTRIVRDKYFTLGHLLQLKVINNCKPRGYLDQDMSCGGHLFYVSRDSPNHLLEKSLEISVEK